MVNSVHNSQQRLDAKTLLSLSYLESGHKNAEQVWVQHYALHIQQFVWHCSQHTSNVVVATGSLRVISKHSLLDCQSFLVHFHGTIILSFAIQHTSNVVVGSCRVRVISKHIILNCQSSPTNFQRFIMLSISMQLPTWLL
jgi:hypothetical protein